MYEYADTNLSKRGKDALWHFPCSEKPAKIRLLVFIAGGSATSTGIEQTRGVDGQTDKGPDCDMGERCNPVLCTLSASQCHERFRRPDKDMGDRHQRHHRVPLLPIHDDGFMM